MARKLVFSLRAMRSMPILRLTAILFFGLLTQTATAQVSPTLDTTRIQIRGLVVGEDGRGIPGCMVVNRTTGSGRFGSAGGRFAWSANRGDTLHFGAIGYHTAVRTADFDVVEGVDCVIELRPLQVALGVAEVLAPRTLREIVEDIEELGYDEKDFRTSGVNAFESPITFLFEQFNRQERSKREVMRMENDDLRRDLLKELLGRYINYDIVQLESAEFDAFVAFVDPGEDLLQALTQYEFILWTKERFIAWRRARDREVGWD
jgi:hypothetical protein